MITITFLLCIAFKGMDWSLWWLLLTAVADHDIAVSICGAMLKWRMIKTEEKWKS